MDENCAVLLGLTDIRSVSTASARYQQLSLNPQKLAGQCGKLKCCLNYELDAYIDGLKDFPKADKWLKTSKGDAVFQKMDIFKRMVWYAYKDQPMHWVALTVDQANEIISKNKEGQKVDSLEYFATPLASPEENTSFTNVVGQDSLTRFDKKKTRQRRKKRNYNRKPPRKNA